MKETTKDKKKQQQQTPITSNIDLHSEIILPRKWEVKPVKLHTDDLRCV